MDLCNNPHNIFFSKEAHTYLTADGVELIGLTSLMAKHGLSADYTGIPDKVLEKAAAEGTAIHEYLQGIDEGTEVFANSLADEYLAAIRKVGLKHIASEYLVSDNEIVATFIDKVYDTGIPNVVDLADVKTTLKYHRRALEWQLGANKVLFERQNPGIKVRNVFCIHIDKKERRLRGLIPVTPVSEAEVDALLDAERSGLRYIDENDVPDVSDVLAPEEAQLIVSNAGKIVELENTIKMLKAADEAIRAKLLDYMEQNNLDKIDAPGGTFTRKKAYSTTRVDSKKLQSQFPAVYEKVKSTSEVKASISYKPKEL